MFEFVLDMLEAFFEMLFESKKHTKTKAGRWIAFFSGFLIIGIVLFIIYFVI